MSTAICDASKSAASEEAMGRAVLGSSGVLLLITDRDDPAVVDARLTAIYAACKQKVRPQRIAVTRTTIRHIPCQALIPK